MFDSLTDLKAFLLPEVIRTDTDFDTEIGILGAGVGAAFEKECNRKFLRVVDDQMIVSADRSHLITERYPIESVSTLEIKSSEAGGWIDQGEAAELINHRTGRVEFSGRLGRFDELARLTYTGGYWVDTTEDNSGTLPDGATQLPADLLLAWLQQCQDFWQRRDKLGASFDTASQSVMAELLHKEMMPTVKATLRQHRRYALT